jgi:hypothetical protein
MVSITGLDINDPLYVQAIDSPSSYLDIGLNTPVINIGGDSSVVTINGYTGGSGNTGLKGPTGERGEQGIQGLQGQTGMQGNQGSTGLQGIQGLTGSTGMQGLIGFTGLQGIQGLTGPTGSQGLIGFTGPTGPSSITLAGDVTGSSSANTIAHVANSATTATASNTNNTIVLRTNATGGTSLGQVQLGDIAMTTGGGFHNLSLNGGNSTGFIYGNYTALGDGIHLGYNYYYPNGGTTGTIPNVAGYTSRLTLSYGNISFWVGAANSAPVEYLSIDHDTQQIRCQGPAVFAGDLVGGCTQLKMNNGYVTLSGNVIPSAAGMVLTSVSSTAAKWDYAPPVYSLFSGGSQEFIADNPIPTNTVHTFAVFPSVGTYLINISSPNFSNTVPTAINNFQFWQGATELISILIPASTPQKSFEVKQLWTFTSTATLTCYGYVDVGTVTYDQIIVSLMKVTSF